MARPKHRANVDVCADCSSPEPAWASVNRAILLCDECCSIHRSLGRHVSSIKSLTRGVWSTNMLNMVRTLNDNGANSIWEHSLLDPSNSKISRRKPQPKDPLHPVKADFIKAKHQELKFILRSCKEDSCSEEELSRQLHSSVRTGNLETSLRLLAQGANPNYFYKEKGTMPLHVAARAGQALQLELLIANGGNSSLVDSSGHTPAEVAKLAGHLDLSERLIECMYEVTDRLSFFLCSRKPDHKKDEHLIIPEWASTIERSELAFEARNKLKMLPNHLLEELVSDVYDEVDRRETDAIWLSSATIPERCIVPFLPIHPQLSSTRNQGRQKLARFTPKEFATLIIDILTEAGQRQTLANSTPLQDPAVIMLRKEQLKKHGSQMSDDEPLYDSVASDDDYAALTSDGIAGLSSITSDNEKALTPMAKGLPSVVEVLKKQLTLSESTTRNLKEEVRRLQRTVDQLMQENRELKIAIQAQARLQVQPEKVINGHIGEHDELEPVLDVKVSTPTKGSQRPVSMYETREGPRKPLSFMNQTKRETEGLPRPCTTQGLWECGQTSLPPSDEVTRRTEQVTRRIQELWMAMQDPLHREAFVPCAERIRVAVAELAAIFPQNPIDDNIRSALRQLNGNTGRLQAECSALQRCTSDLDHMDRCLQQVRSSAYDIAKATKLLVTQFQLS
ncbi:ARF GTPase-activating protein GIT2 [Phymastichus coffea]|uniref:ARF GTPase-activating protein GIT2 n=1 Tax=Phymastichus coffea TaxID=108790 RepID=UPI00273A856F|nr:ARF GTPase-activating protein GIT2 [Phymastichus coffea]